MADPEIRIVMIGAGDIIGWHSALVAAAPVQPRTGHRPIRSPGRRRRVALALGNVGAALHRAARDD